MLFLREKIPQRGHGGAPGYPKDDSFGSNRGVEGLSAGAASLYPLDGGTEDGSPQPAPLSLSSSPSAW